MRTPFIGDGYFNDEMGELFEYTVAVGDVVGRAGTNPSEGAATRLKARQCSVEA